MGIFKSKQEKSDFRVHNKNNALIIQYKIKLIPGRECPNYGRSGKLAKLTPHAFSWAPHVGGGRLDAPFVLARPTAFGPRRQADTPFDAGDFLDFVLGVLSEINVLGKH